MPLQVLLLLILLGSDSSLQLRETWENGTIEAPDPLLVQGQKQVEEDPEQDMYDYIGTDPPETLFTNSPGPVSLSPATWHHHLISVGTGPASSKCCGLEGRG